MTEIINITSIIFIALPIVFLVIIGTDPTNYKPTKNGMAYGKPKIEPIPVKTLIVCAIIILIGLILRIFI